MSALDTVSTGIDGASTVIDRIDVDRVAGIVADLATADVATTAAAAAGQVVDQVVTAVEYTRRSNRMTQIAVAAGLATLLATGLFFIRRRTTNTTVSGASLEDQTRAGGAASPN